jgi:hypothetical protein
VTPSKDFAGWSFGPDRMAHTKERYVEIDVFVREHVGDDASWKKFPWYAQFDREKEPDKALLFKLRPDSYVLIFPRARP